MTDWTDIVSLNRFLLTQAVSRVIDFYCHYGILDPRSLLFSHVWNPLTRSNVGSALENTTMGKRTCRNNDCACVKVAKDKRLPNFQNSFSKSTFWCKSRKCKTFYWPKHFGIYLSQWTENSIISKSGLFLYISSFCKFVGLVSTLFMEAKMHCSQRLKNLWPPALSRHVD